VHRRGGAFVLRKMSRTIIWGQMSSGASVRDSFKVLLYDDLVNIVNFT